MKNSQVFKIASAFYLGFARERIKILFLISDVSVGNITLCLGQPDARELRVERASSKPRTISRIPFSYQSECLQATF